jgi:hypothetical protein
VKGIKKITVNIKTDTYESLKELGKFKGGYTALINFALETFLKSDKAKQWEEFYRDA